MSLSPQYLTTLQAFQTALVECINASREYAGVPARSSRHFLASMFVTTFCTRATSLSFIVPQSGFVRTTVDLWDYASVASLTRALLEIRLLFYTTCVEQCSDDEIEARLTLLHLNDCANRKALFRDIDDQSPQIAEFEHLASTVRDKLSRNLFFLTLAPKRRKELLKGRDAQFTSSSRK